MDDKLVTERPQSLLSQIKPIGIGRRRERNVLPGGNLHLQQHCRQGKNNQIEGKQPEATAGNIKSQRLSLAVDQTGDHETGQDDKHIHRQDIAVNNWQMPAE